MDGTTGRDRTHFGSFLRRVGDELINERHRCIPSIPPPAANWRRLSTETSPQAGESLRGLVAKVCQRNDLPNSWGLLQHLGQQHRNRVLVSEDPNIDPAELAFAIRVAEHEVRSRRYEPLMPGRISFFGLDLNPRSIDTHTRRFSPIALQRADQRFHRAVWELRDLPFCFEGWDMLQDRCGCETEGVVQGWTRTLTRIEECDKCGDPLHWLEPFEVPSDLRPALEVLRALVDPLSERRLDAAKRLPTDLRDANRSAMFDLVVRIADAIDPQAPDRSIEMPGERLDALHQACSALTSWPNGLDRIDWHETTSSSAIFSMRSAWYRLQPSLGKRALAPSIVKLKQKELSPVGIRPATEIAKLSPEVLLAAWEHGVVTRHRRVHGSRALPAFDPAELAELGSEWRDRVEPDAFAHSLGISYHGVEQMVALDVIIADARALPGTGPHFKSDTWASFMAQLAEPTMLLSEDLVPLTFAATLIGGRPKPWGPILQALMDGQIRFALRDAARPIERIMIKRSEVPKICTMTFDRTQHPEALFADRMIQRDALEMLNVSAAAGRLLKGLPSEGRNPRTFAVADVEGRAAEIASLTEIAAHMRTDVASAYARLQEIPVAELVPGGWNRAKLATLGYASAV